MRVAITLAIGLTQLLLYIIGQKRDYFFLTNGIKRRASHIPPSHISTRHNRQFHQPSSHPPCITMAHASSASEQAGTASTTSHHVPQFSGLLESGKYSDLTLTCDSRSWKVHKGVLCLQSDFFAKACDGDFRVSNARAAYPKLPLTEV